MEKHHINPMNQPAIIPPNASGERGHSRGFGSVTHKTDKLTMDRRRGSHELSESPSGIFERRDTRRRDTAKASATSRSSARPCPPYWRDMMKIEMNEKLILILSESSIDDMAIRLFDKSTGEGEAALSIGRTQSGRLCIEINGEDKE